MQRRVKEVEKKKLHEKTGFGVDTRQLYGRYLGPCDMVVSTSFAVVVVGVLVIGAPLLGVHLGPLICCNFRSNVLI